MSIYLIRHARPDFGPDERLCIGSTDIPLGDVGKMQCVVLSKFLHFDTVYASALSRAVETASFISDKVICDERFNEMYFGVWDGLSFDEIKAGWPDLYEKRGKDPSILPPNAETSVSGAKRFSEALEDAGNTVTGELAVVSHRSIISAYMNCPSDCYIPYTGYLKDGELIVPELPLTPELCLEFLEVLDIPDEIVSHSKAVAKKALELSKDRCLDLNLIECSSLLHDMARTGENHAYAGSRMLSLLGYEDASEIVRQHHDLDEIAVSEASAVFLADKYIKGNSEVSLDERFSSSFEKCKTEEARKAHERRYLAAKECERMFGI